jgi:23S rRNA pseudouridine1911/1915/1917 synthase
VEASGTVWSAAPAGARACFAARFRGHEVVRIYHALGVGRPRPAAGVVESRLAVGVDDRVRSGGGQRAVTYYRVLAQQEDLALVECELQTGRRNQIRVHLAECGWPVVGDRKYGRVHGYKKDLLRQARRTLLHAIGLGIDAPAGGMLTATASWPDDFKSVAGAELGAQAEQQVAARLRDLANGS